MGAVGLRLCGNLRRVVAMFNNDEDEKKTCVVVEMGLGI